MLLLIVMPQWITKHLLLRTRTRRTATLIFFPNASPYSVAVYGKSPTSGPYIIARHICLSIQNECVHPFMLLISRFCPIWAALFFFLLFTSFVCVLTKVYVLFIWCSPLFQP